MSSLLISSDDILALILCGNVLSTLNYNSHSETHGKTGSLLQALPNQRLPRLSQANYIVIVQKSSCPMALSIIISEIIRFRSSATTVERKTNLMKKKHRVTVASALLQRCFSVASETAKTSSFETNASTTVSHVW